MIKSLQTRLLLGTTIASALVLCLLALAVHAAVRRALFAEFDQSLIAKAKALGSMVEQYPSGIKFEFDVHDLPSFGNVERPDYFDVWIEGRHYASSPSLANRNLGDIPLNVDQATVITRVLPDGRPGRILVLPTVTKVETDDGAPMPVPLPVTIAVAGDTQHLGDILARLQWMMTALCAAAIALSGTILLLVVRRTLLPVNRLAKHLEERDESVLAAKLDPGGIPSELLPMVNTLNALFARLQEAFDRERSFTADVAHELRTPIAGLRATLQVCRSRLRDPVAYQVAIDKSLAMLGSMQSLVENLLLLARADAGQIQPSSADIDLAELLHESWTPFAVRAAAGGLCVEWNLPADLLPVRTDLATWRIILANLFDNAVSYTNAGGMLRIKLSPGADTVNLEIANTGNVIAEADVPQVFERFWRNDASRSQTGLHAGLGLSLCQRLIRLAGGTIDAAAAPDGWFTVKVSLPIQRAPEAGRLIAAAMNS